MKPTKMDADKLRELSEELERAISDYYSMAIIHGMVYYVWGGHHDIAVWADAKNEACDDAKALARRGVTLRPAPPAGLDLEERSRRFVEVMFVRQGEYPELAHDLQRVVEMPEALLHPEDWRRGMQAIYDIAEKHGCWFYEDNPLDDWTVANRRLVHPIAPYQTLYKLVARLVADERAALFFAPGEDPCPLIPDPSYDTAEGNWFAEAVEWRKRMNALLGKVQSRALGELVSRGRDLRGRVEKKGERRKQRDWQCPGKTYIEVGAKRLALVVRGKRESFYVRPRTRARAILDCLLVYKVAKPDVIKREILEATPNAVNESPSRLVSKENRQVFKPRIGKYLPDIPDDVIHYDREHDVYACRIPIRAAVDDDEDV